MLYRLAVREKTDVNLSLRIGRPFHPQRHRIALPDNARNPGGQAAVIEQVHDLHGNEGLSGVGPLRVLRGKKVGAQHDEVEANQHASTQHRQMMLAKAPPNELPVGSDGDTVLCCRGCNGDRLHIGHGYRSIRMRGSTSASRISDSSVPTIVRNE